MRRRANLARRALRLTLFNTDKQPPFIIFEFALTLLTFSLMYWVRNTVSAVTQKNRHRLLFLFAWVAGWAGAQQMMLSKSLLEMVKHKVRGQAFPFAVEATAITLGTVVLTFLQIMSMCEAFRYFQGGFTSRSSSWACPRGGPKQWAEGGARIYDGTHVRACRWLVPDAMRYDARVSLSLLIQTHATQRNAPTDSTLAFVSTYKAVLLVLGEMTGAFYFDELATYTVGQGMAIMTGSSVIVLGMLLMTIVDQWERRNFNCESCVWSYLRLSLPTPPHSHNKTDKELLIAYGRDAQDSEYLEREVQRLRADRDALKAAYIFRAVWAAFFDTRPSAKFVEEDLKLVRRERARAKFRTMAG